MRGALHRPGPHEFVSQRAMWRRCSKTALRLSSHAMTTLPPCPKCESQFTYEDGTMLVCPECAHEWPKDAAPSAASEGELVVRDAHGNTLADGDSVTVIKDLKVKGSSSVVKVGTKVKGIRLVEGDHNIDCRIEGIGEMKLKSEFVKKA
jgi:protein PhnA